jgi:hypothetical protein
MKPALVKFGRRPSAGNRSMGKMAATHKKIITTLIRVHDAVRKPEG